MSERNCSCGEYPGVGYKQCGYHYRLERIATAAMQGLISNPSILERYGLASADVAKESVIYSKALIAELDKDQSHE